MEKKFVAAFGTADAVITGVHAGLTVWRAVLTQLSGRVCVGAGRTLHYTRTVLIQEISCTHQCTIRIGQMFQCIAMAEESKYLYL